MDGDWKQHNMYSRQKPLGLNQLAPDPWYHGLAYNSYVNPPSDRYMLLTLHHRRHQGLHVIDTRAKRREVQGHQRPDKAEIQ